MPETAGFRTTTFAISEALDLLGRHLFGNDWTGTEIEAGSDADPTGFRLLRVARRELRAALYHGHVQAWTVTLQNERKMIPPDAWGREGNLIAGCFLDSVQRTRIGLHIDEATSSVDGLLAQSNSRNVDLRELLRKDTNDSATEPVGRRRRSTRVYVDREALSACLAAPGSANAHGRESLGRGRRQGDGSYDQADNPLIDEMHNLLVAGQTNSVSGAAASVVDRAAGSGTRDRWYGPAFPAERR